MGLWLTVGKAALKVGVPALAKFARQRLFDTQVKARHEDYLLEDGQFHASLRRAEKKDRRARAKASR